MQRLKFSDSGGGWSADADAAGHAAVAEERASTRGVDLCKNVGGCDKLISLLVVVSAMIARGRPCMDGYVRATAAWRGRVVVADCAGRYLCIACFVFYKNV